MKHTWIAGVMEATALVALGGCLVMSGKDIEESGVKVSPSTLSQVQVGCTTEQWLLATLGEPTGRAIVSEQPKVEVLRYVHHRRESEGGAVLFIFAGGKETEETTTAYFELTDGVVTRSWTEA